MPRAHANGIEIEYETFGASDARPLLLVMGLGAQLVEWPVEFCESLARRGHHVIRFDNRDAGLSTRFEDAPTPGMIPVAEVIAAGRVPEIAYGLGDMADDAAGLLDALGLASAHVCGASMGGMIAQKVAIRHPKRVRTLVSIMSTTGAPDLPPPTPGAVEALTRPPATDRASAIQATLDSTRAVEGPGHRHSDEVILERARCNHDRAFPPEGRLRQLVAIVADGDRTADLSRLRQPTLVIHGQDDPLVRVECGIATAAAVPHSELMIIEGMGHDLHPDLHDEIAEAISKLTFAHD